MTVPAASPHPDDPLDAVRDAALATVAEAVTLEILLRDRAGLLGDKSPLLLARRALGQLPAAERKEAGQRVNAALTEVSSAYEQKKDVLETERDARVLVEEAVDVTVLRQSLPHGARHPLTTVIERAADVFVAMGWEVAEGPELEHAWFNFDALNIPAHHPAREEQDTLWIEPEGSGLLLRTQTSPVQIRTLLERGAPCYVVAPGRVFRNDSLDATHSPVFAQLEGLCVDEGITMAHLRGTLQAFSSAMYGEGLATRLRPSYFPFTEPSAELDVQCFRCRGSVELQPCRVCSDEGWIEGGGCGMVNPAVLRACGVDPDRYSGFAFGMGLDRAVMVRHEVADIRDLYEGDVRFSSAFGSGV